MKYEFEIIDESDIGETANIIAVILKYTFDNVETISDDMLGYLITYDGRSICTIYRDMEGVLELRDQDEVKTKYVIRAVGTAYGCTAFDGES